MGHDAKKAVRDARRKIIPGEGGCGTHKNKYPKGEGRTRNDVEDERRNQQGHQER